MKKNKKLMKIKGLLLAFLMASTCFVFAGCNSGEKIYIYNWGDYIDMDLIKQFKKETGITVKQETFESNEAMYTKLVSGAGGYDLLFPSDYMIERLINEDMLRELNFDNIPNYQYIDDTFKGLDYDPGNKYSVAYMWGTLGILYNTKMVDDVVDSWDILWNEKYSGKIFMYDSSRDSIGLALIRLGYSVNSTNVDELNEATASLIKQKALTKAYLVDPIKDKMIGEEGAIAVVYSGDAMYCQSENPDLDFAIPKEGSNVFTDCMVIPKDAKNPEGAEKFIDFLCRPEVSAQNSEYIGYTTPNSAAIPLMDKEITENHIFWATEEELERCEIYKDLGDFKKILDDAWNNDVVISS